MQVSVERANFKILYFTADYQRFLPALLLFCAACVFRHPTHTCFVLHIAQNLLMPYFLSELTPSRIVLLRLNHTSCHFARICIHPVHRSLLPATSYVSWIKSIPIHLVPHFGVTMLKQQTAEGFTWARGGMGRGGALIAACTNPQPYMLRIES